MVKDEAKVMATALLGLGFRVRVRVRVRVSACLVLEVLVACHDQLMPCGQQYEASLTPSAV